MIDEPQTERLGAKVAAPVFARIADFALKRLGIPPSAGAELPLDQTAGQVSTTDTTVSPDSTDTTQSTDGSLDSTSTTAASEDGSQSD
jgi:hypothetical protein